MVWKIWWMDEWMHITEQMDGDRRWTRRRHMLNATKLSSNITKLSLDRTKLESDGIRTDVRRKFDESLMKVWRMLTAPTNDATSDDVAVGDYGDVATQDLHRWLTPTQRTSHYNSRHCSSRRCRSWCYAGFIKKNIMLHPTPRVFEVKPFVPKRERVLCARERNKQRDRERELWNLIYFRIHYNPIWFRSSKLLHSRLYWLAEV